MVRKVLVILLNFKTIFVQSHSTADLKSLQHIIRRVDNLKRNSLHPSTARSILSFSTD